PRASWWHSVRYRSIPYGTCYSCLAVTSINADDVRIPRRAREALARHEEVVVLNRERPVYVLVNPEDHARASGPARKGRPLREALAMLAGAPLPDPDFGEDLEAIRDAIGPMPEDPWAPS
ncbi:MAG: hypothetical protein QOE72_2293, partial [Chloroflexota bacterium]|nr:hypothetical protein [Chloroflexota bacterium]